MLFFPLDGWNVLWFIGFSGAFEQMRDEGWGMLSLSLAPKFGRQASGGGAGAPGDHSTTVRLRFAAYWLRCAGKDEWMSGHRLHVRSIPQVPRSNDWRMRGEDAGTPTSDSRRVNKPGSRRTAARRFPTATRFPWKSQRLTRCSTVLTTSRLDTWPSSTSPMSTVNLSPSSIAILTTSSGRLTSDGGGTRDATSAVAASLSIVWFCIEEPCVASEQFTRLVVFSLSHDNTTNHTPPSLTNTAIVASSFASPSRTRGSRYRCARPTLSWFAPRTVKFPPGLINLYFHLTFFWHFIPFFRYYHG